MGFEFKNVLVTGAAGFIGFHLCRQFLKREVQITGIDNLNPYYDVGLKKDRLDNILSAPNFKFVEMDMAHRADMQDLFNNNKFDVVVNLAAQAGVRYSIENPNAYVDSNLVGFVNILEGCRHSRVKHLVFASSSSVYGANTTMPFSIHHNVDHPVSLYAATKKSNELMAHTYSHLYGLACTGLRFFTVYGPWGRPDMALFLFTKAILEDKPIKVFNHGKMQRDFTYIDDIITGVIALADAAELPPCEIFNIGNNRPEELLGLITTIEKALGKKANMELLPMQPGDVLATYANIDRLAQTVGFAPTTPMSVGVPRFVQWYRDHPELAEGSAQHRRGSTPNP